MVNISSVFGLTAQPLMSGHNASKYGVRGFTEPLRQDLELEKSFVTPPAKAADVVVEAVRRGKWRVLVGPDARVFDAIARIAPAGYQRLITAIVRSRGRGSR